MRDLPEPLKKCTSSTKKAFELSCFFIRKTRTQKWGRSRENYPVDLAPADLTIIQNFKKIGLH